MNKLTQIWNEISLETLQNLIKSMPERIKAVIENNGGHTKY